MLELTTLLQQSIRLDRDITARQQIHWRPQERLQNAMVSLDVELAEMANTSNGSKFGRFIVAKRILIRHTAQRC